MAFPRVELLLAAVRGLAFARPRLLTAAFAPRATLESEDNRLYTYLVRIEWDPPKARANLHTHGISLTEAATVLDDDFALTREDPGADDESRFVTLGLSDVGNLLEGEQAPEGAL